MKKRALTLLESIFMIVVIGLVMPFLPYITHQSNLVIESFNKSTYFTLGYTKAILSSKKLWDENNTNDLATTGKYYVLNTNATSNQNSLLNCTSNYRSGHYQAQNRRKCSTTNLSATTLGVDTPETFYNFDDVDDFNDTVTYYLFNNTFIKTVRLSDNFDNTYLAGDNITVTVNFTEPITVTGIPTIDIDINNVTRQASYVSGSGSNSLVFEYTTVMSDSGKVTLIENSLDATSATLKTASSVDIDLPFRIDNEIITKVEYINYVFNNGTNTITTNVVNTNVTETTDVKRITLQITDFKDKNPEFREVYTYFYYATNIGTDIPLVKVNN